MFRSTLVATVIVATSVSPLVALGDSLSPDGTPMTRENYPLELALRPLAAPRGLLQIEANLEQPFRPDPPPGRFYLVNQSLTFSAAVSYGLGNAFEVLAGCEFGGSDGGWLTLLKQFGRFTALALRVGYDAQTGPDYNTHTWWTSMGVPLKLLLPHVPLAIRGLDTIFYASSATLIPSVMQAVFFDVGNISRTTIEGELPIWLEFSPLRFLTMSGGATAYLYNQQQRSTSTTDGTISAYGSVYGTFPWVDIGIGVTHYVYLNSNPPLTEAWLHFNLRLWT